MEPMRTIGYICPKCGKAVIASRTVFALQAGPAAAVCDCGDSEFISETDGLRFRLTVPCGICGGEHIAEVDAKLIRLAYEMGGVVVTNDYNLNKVAGVQNVPVLNINELANAIKPLALPGEEMEAAIVKEGKEAGQGVAYLDDGTMIVVEAGKRYLGETVTVLVTSVLQTSAGRMIFAKVK